MQLAAFIAQQYVQQCNEASTQHELRAQPEQSLQKSRPSLQNSSLTRHRRDKRGR